MTPISCAFVGVAVVLGTTTPVAAWPGGGGWLHYELGGLHAVEAEPGADRRAEQLVLAGVRVHGFVGGRLAYHIGLDAAAGASIGRSGFAYDVALFPLGLALRLGGTGVIAAGAGVGVSGAVGTLDDALLLPIELVAELGGGRVRVLARARASFAPGERSRQDGAPSTDLADELDAMLGVRVSERRRQFGFTAGDGYFVGASYRELAGQRFVGVVLGLSIDGATIGRRWRRGDD